MRRQLLIPAVAAAAFAAGLALGAWLVSPGEARSGASADREVDDSPGAPGPASDGSPGARGDRPTAAPAAGKWRPARTPRGQNGESDAWERPKAAEALMAMPYLQGYRSAAGRAGTVRAPRPGAVQPGLNLYTSGHAAEAVLMDADGRVLHRWAYPLERFRPALFEGAEASQLRKMEYFRRARLLPDGSLLAIYEGLGLAKLSPRSQLVWGYAGGAHHDLDIARDGTIWVLDREGRLIPRIDPDRGVLEDFVTVLSPDGGVLRRISILEAFEGSDYAALLERLPDQEDILHTNTLEILDGRLADRHPAFRAGNVLLSVLELDTVAVLDPDSGTIVWALTGMWRKQHQPTMVDGGRMLVFDNMGAGQERSRVLELDPLTQRIVWRHREDLFSRTLGSCQRLANGNTLITESENGRAIEVAPDGEVVWEFLTPHRVVPEERGGEAGNAGELVAVLFEVERLPPEFPFRGLSDRGSASGRAGR